MRRGVCKAEGVPGQSTSVVQAKTRYPTLPIIRSYREGDQFGFAARAGPGAETDLLRQQSVTRARGEILGLRKSGSGCSILSGKTSPLLPELHRNSDGRPSNSQGLIEARCSRQDSAMGGGAQKVRCAVRA